MPTIPIYNAPNTPIEIPNRGVEALATGARRLGQLGNERANEIRGEYSDIAKGAETLGKGVASVGEQYQNLEGQQDVLGVSKVAAALQNNLAQQWQKVSTSGHPEDAQAFLSDYANPAIEELYSHAQTAKGRAYATSQMASLQMHWADRINEGQSQMMGSAASTNWQSTKLDLTNSVATDPAHTPLALDHLAQANEAAAQAAGSPAKADAIRAMLPAAQSDALVVSAHKQISDAVANGQDPNAVVADFTKKYGARLGGDRVEQLTAWAEREGVHAQNDAKIKAASDLRVAWTKSEDALPGVFDTTLKGLTSGTHVLPANLTSQINNNPDLTPDAKNAYNTSVAKIASGTAAKTSDTDTLDDIVSGKLIPEADKDHTTNTDILTAIGHGRMSPADGNFVMNATPQQLSHVNNALAYGRSFLAPTDPGSGKIDLVKLTQYNQYQKWVMENAVKGTLPETDKLQTIVPAFKGWTLTPTPPLVKPGEGAPPGTEVTWGTPPAPESGLGKVEDFFKGLFSGKK